MVKIGSFLGVFGGISAILVFIALVWVPGLASTWNWPKGDFDSINVFIPFFVILFSIVNSESNRLSSSAIIILSCFSFLFAEKIIAACMWISLAGGVMAFLSLANINDKKCALIIKGN